MSAFDLCRWSWNCAWLLGYVYLSLHSGSVMPLLQRGTLPACPPVQTAAPGSVCPLCWQRSWSLAFPRPLSISIGVAGVDLVVRSLVSVSCESCQLPAGLSAALTFPCLRKTPFAPRSAALLPIRPAPEQLPLATD